MNDPSRTKAELIKENSFLKQRIQELEKSEEGRKRANDELRESEEKARILLSGSSDPIFSFTPEGQYRYANRAFAEGVGKLIEDIIGKNIWDVFPKDEADKRFASLSEVFRTGQEKVIEVRVPRADGDRYYITTITPIKDTKGEMLSVVCSSKDITDRKRAVEELQESEELFRVSMESAPDGVYMNDFEGNFLYGNRKAEEIIGYRREELIGRNFLNLNIIAEDSLIKAVEVLKANSEGKSTGPDELELIRKDGRHILIEINTTVLQRRGKKDVLGFVRDITERKRTEKKLRESETMLRSILEAVPFTIAVLDSNRILRNVNDGASEMFGYSRDEVIGRNSRFLYFSDKEYKQVAKALYGNTLVKGSSSIEARMRRKDGTEIWVLLNTSPLQTEDYSASSVVVAIDVTARKFLESQLRQAHKMEAIGTLAGGIAHDFNNILGAILGYAEIALTDSNMNDRLRRYLGQIYKAGERATELVKQILAYSRQSDQKPRPLRVSPIIKEVLNLLRASLPATITIHQDIQSEPDTVLADSTQIHQILMNLCTNAAHAMRETKGELKISLVPVEIKPRDPLIILHGLTPDTYLKLTVSDTGVGIAPDIVERIFDPFFTTKKPGEGTGLGLSAVHGFVKSYHGAVTVESDVGKGSVFHVYLPLLKEALEKREIDDAAPIARGEECILFVDDEEMLVQIGKDMLTGLGYRVVERTSSLEALKLFQSHPERFDLVITDMTMPNMTGIELAKKIMRIRPGIPIILCTGFSEEITPGKAKDLGLKDFIMKPIIKNHIAEAIRRVLDHEE